MVNCMPVFIARENVLAAAASRSTGVPIIGDDIKSQVGATITHRVLTSLFRDRGVRSTARTSSTSAATPTS